MEMGEISRRSFLARSTLTASGVLLGSGALAACTSGSRASGGTAIKRGGHLTVGLASEQQGFNPATGRFDPSGFVCARAVFDPLMIITAQGTVAPYLAESITPNADHTDWAITLRPGVRFHDGASCDGAALEQNFTTQLTSPLNGVALRPLIGSCRQSGPRSVAVMMKHPWVNFPYMMAEQQFAFVAAPSMLDAPDGGSAHPIGTGPFVFSEWIPNDHFSVTANSAYWRPGLPYLDKITFKPIPDGQARVQALESGAIGMMHSPEPRTIKLFEGSASYASVNNTGQMVGSPAVSMVMLNMAKAPFDDPVARRILAQGMSSEAYAKIIDLGVNAPANGLYQKGSPYDTPVPYPTYNATAAKAAATAYAREHGGSLRFELNVLATPQLIRQGEYYQQVMKNIGVEVSLKTMQQNVLISSALAGEFQATGWSQFGGMVPDLNYIWLSPETANEHGFSINLARNIDPQIQTAFLTGMASTDAIVRNAAFAKVNERLAVDLPYIWLDRASWTIVSDKDVQGWKAPTCPDGEPALGQEQGLWWLTQAWTA